MVFRAVSTIELERLEDRLFVSMLELLLLRDSGGVALWLLLAPPAGVFVLLLLLLLLRFDCLNSSNQWHEMTFSISAVIAWNRSIR